MGRIFASVIAVFIALTGQYMLTIEGLCSLGNYDKQGTLSVTCKTGVGQYKKHFLGLSDNVTFIVEQIAPATVDGRHYKVIFKPDAILPDIDIR